MIDPALGMDNWAVSAAIDRIMRESQRHCAMMRQAPAGLLLPPPCA